MGVDKQSLDLFFEKAKSEIKKDALMALTKLGEECIVRIRDRSKEESWIDRTGNLRSSVGYAVVDDGSEFIKSQFQIVLNGTEGKSLGEEYLRDVEREYKRVMALVVVAGMPYAEDVERIESKDVLESTRIWAELVVKDKLTNAFNYSMKKINSWRI